MLEEDLTREKIKLRNKVFWNLISEHLQEFLALSNFVCDGLIDHFNVSGQTRVEYVPSTDLC